MKKLTDKQKLELLRGLIDNADYDETAQSLGFKDWESAIKLLNQIHRIVHPYEGCRHLDWEDEAAEMYKEIKK